MTQRRDFTLGDYVEVKDRILAFYEQHPAGSLQSEVIELTDKRVTVKAWAYRTPDDPRPGIGHSYLNIPGGTPYTRGSEIENAETSAWGRALAAIGLRVQQGIASQDEIRGKQGQQERRGRGNAQPARTNAQNRPVEASASTFENVGQLLNWALAQGVGRPKVLELLNVTSTVEITDFAEAKAVIEAFSAEENS